VFVQPVSPLRCWEPARGLPSFEDVSGPPVLDQFPVPWARRRRRLRSEASWWISESGCSVSLGFVSDFEVSPG